MFIVALDLVCEQIKKLQEKMAKNDMIGADWLQHSVVYVPPRRSTGKHHVVVGINAIVIERLVSLVQEVHAVPSEATILHVISFALGTGGCHFLELLQKRFSGSNDLRGVLNGFGCHAIKDWRDSSVDGGYREFSVVHRSHRQPGVGSPESQSIGHVGDSLELSISIDVLVASGDAMVCIAHFMLCRVDVRVTILGVAKLIPSGELG